MVVILAVSFLGEGIDGGCWVGCRTNETMNERKAHIEVFLLLSFSFFFSAGVCR